MKRRPQVCGKYMTVEEYRAQELLYFSMQYQKFLEDIEDLEAVAHEVAGDQWKGFLAGICVSKSKGHIMETLESNGCTFGKNQFVKMRIRFIELLDVVRERRELERMKRRKELRSGGRINAEECEG